MLSESSMITTAVVTNNRDPDDLGRVKVQYPWSSSTDESYWARVSTPMAGDRRGLYFIPEVEDEVIVAFINGDTQSPIVIGSLWNQSDKPPQDNSSGKNDIRKIRSRSGHEIIFDDGEGESKLEIVSSAGHRVIFDDSKGSEKITIKDSSGGSIEMDSITNKLSIKSAMKISIEATQIDIKASAELVLQGALIRIN